MCNQLLWQFGGVLPFLQSHLNFAPETTTKLTQLLCNAQKAAFQQLELATIVDCGEKFVKATYALEGDGPLLFQCYDIFKSLYASIHTTHFPNLAAVAEKLIGGGSTARVQQYIHYEKTCFKIGLDYFATEFANEMSESVSVFEAAQLFVPWKVAEMQPTAASVHDLKSFPFLNALPVLRNLKSELSLYLSKAFAVSPSTDIILWLKNHSTEPPHWSDAVCKVLLVQSSSAAAERVFSIVKSSFGPQQDRSLQDYVQSSLMLQYNKKINYFIIFMELLCV